MLDELNHANKHVARFVAILSLYSHEMQDQRTIAQIAKSIKKAYLEKDLFDLGLNLESLALVELHAPDEELLEQLIRLSEENREAIEQLVKDNLIAKYNFDRLDKVIKAVLRLASLELLYCGDVPAKIIIDEYVSLTKTFYENNEAGFVNKVIDVMARAARSTEII
jgi:transcription antitermination factor NusB